MEERPPIWRKWNLVPEATVWEAVALSLNIEPSQVRHGRDAWINGPGSRYFEESEEFVLRFEVCRRNVGNAQWPIQLTQIIMNDPGACSVRLDQFAAWAIHIGWEVPDEFRDIAERAGDAEIDDKVKKRPGESSRVTATTSANRWPWGTHETELLRKLAEAATRFWVNFDPEDATTAPTNEQVIEWLKTEGVALRNAEVIATMLRADGLPPGPRK